MVKRKYTWLLEINCPQQTACLAKAKQNNPVQTAYVAKGHANNRPTSTKAICLRWHRHTYKK